MIHLTHQLEGVSKVRSVHHRLEERFVLLFREKWLDIRFGDGPRSMSNWTYHTALAIADAAKELGLNCTFETRGRLDAVIDTFSDELGVLFYAEWESRHRTVFGEGKELDKLWDGASSDPISHGFLFTYCPIEDYYSFTKDVVINWQQKKPISNRFPSLFLTTVVTKGLSKNNFPKFYGVLERNLSTLFLDRP